MSWFKKIHWSEAEEIAGCRLDRRRQYYKHTEEGRKVKNGFAFNGLDWTPDCKLLTYGTWMEACSGCSDDSEYSCPTRGGGCPECGYHGVLRQGMHSPFDFKEE